MTLTSWIAELRAAGVTRVVLDIAPASAGAQPYLPQPQLHSSFPADQAPRDPVTNAQAESTNVHPESADEADADQRARDLELMHSG